MWTLFRNANQWYSITSWLEGFNPKASRAWGRTHRWGCGKQNPHKNRSLGGAESLWYKKNLNSSSAECTTKVKYKIDHNSKTKNRTKKKSEAQTVSQHCAYFETTYFYIFLFGLKHLIKIVNKISINSRNKNRKNRKIDF